MFEHTRKLRALWRLAQFSGLTATYTAELVSKQAVKEVGPRETAEHMRAWCRELLGTLGVEVEVEGTPPRTGALLVANHRSYIDIAVLGAQLPMLFLAKAEIAEWPIVGFGARRAHVLFVKREDPASRAASRGLLKQRLSEGVSVAVFPEGTSTRGPGVQPFRPGSFQIVSGTMLPVVPVAIQYEDPEDAWYGDATFLRHFLERFGRRQLKARVAFGPPMRHADAKQLRDLCEQWVAQKLAHWEGAAPTVTSSPTVTPSRIAAGGLS